MEKTTKPTGEHEAEQMGARDGDKRDGSSPVSQPVKDATREPKQVNENSPRPDKAAPKG